jgi:hypothetical protein
MFAIKNNASGYMEYKDEKYNVSDTAWSPQYLRGAVISHESLCPLTQCLFAHQSMQQKREKK